MSSKGAIALFGVLLFLPALASAQSGSQAVLMPGDSIQILVWQRPELSGVFAVRPDGSIGSPFYSEVQVAGIPLPQAEQQVYDYISNIEVAPRVIVDGFFQVSVGGEVRQPGVYGLPMGTTMSQAVLRAGGVTEQGRLSRVVLYRNGQPQILDVSSPDPTMGGMPIQSGDQLVVSQRSDFFRTFVIPLITITGAAAAVLNVLNENN